MKRKELKALQRKEAIARLSALTRHFHLHQHILDYYKQGRVYYSYLWGLFMCSIDTIEYDPRYVKVMADFEVRTQSIVYHAIEFGRYSEYLALLSVSSNPANWPSERLDGDKIQVYVHNFENPDDSKEMILTLDSAPKYDGCLIAKEYAFGMNGFKTYGKNDGVDVVIVI